MCSGDIDGNIIVWSILKNNGNYLGVSPEKKITLKSQILDIGIPSNLRDTLIVLGSDLCIKIYCTQTGEVLSSLESGKHPLIDFLMLEEQNGAKIIAIDNRNVLTSMEVDR